MKKSQGFFNDSQIWLNWLMDDLPHLGYITKLTPRKKKEKKREENTLIFLFSISSIILNYFKLLIKIIVFL
jgi:hypothetical protein